ncbi:uncharacterized protein LOC126840030 isoform X1 [Adelges cooleyi]|uniref:uncharacterized protein LOC126840030 isoform X1 n=2 Tax=Adelges cooleyi TaxID=133065 RepID=UPI0021800A55|nr:uncharacterized protein LOC126840030 isoform X1 [Adelges cooleyi]XP_050431474.1 uncharacterized protein LOC126840030 isoform X1 [Adelges cooleyi]
MSSVYGVTTCNNTLFLHVIISYVYHHFLYESYNFILCIFLYFIVETLQFLITGILLYIIFIFKLYILNHTTVSWTLSFNLIIIIQFYIMEHGGFIYDNLGKKKGVTYYQCAKRGLNFCKGSLKKSTDGTLIIIKPHNGHEIRDNNEMLIKSFRLILKTRASKENGLLKLIYDQESERNPEASSLYSWATAESIMRIARRHSLPKLPTSCTELAVLFENGTLPRYSCCNESIFKGCVLCIDGHQSLIFACTGLIQLVANVEEIHVDATFKIVSPNMGKQLLTIHCMIQNHSIPVVYCLMESKSRNAYISVLNFVKSNIVPNLNPSVIITDFGTALRDTLISLFPQARVAGCWFHHNQAVWKNMKKKGFLHLINTNGQALKALRMLFALPLLPAADIERAYEVIRLFAINHQVPMTSLFSYYRSYWIGQVGVHVFSVHGLSRRTNNNVESFHNSLRLKLSVAHPNLWIFLNQLARLSMNYHTIVNQLSNNIRPTRNYRVNYVINSNRIKNATSQYSQGLMNMWQFLQICSHTTTAYEQRQRNWALQAEINSNPNAYIPLSEDNRIDDSAVAEELIANIPVAISEGANETVNIDDNDSLDDESRCVTCLVRTLRETPIRYMITPCGHAWICNSCMLTILRSDPIVKCPVCRQSNSHFQRVFFTF